ncbi:DUF2182 domain-containing protein [Phyllobacterium zundukense]|uniref:Metal-binding protein n=1 Tax=Phyllobacterium zundukense TaxID=1867719 RepID=A0A2N9W2X0_9HYPH|nr:DUF2182 domain-containing protein [Phyllobacterium zundukense]ATU94204.1 metal-binding protein [Phyllobacterium zundukense]PIO46088.1 metal-binding protein [Phyllobacterium zundukense]
MTALEAILRRDRAVVALSIAVLTVIAWIHIVWFAHTMSIGDAVVTGMDMDNMAGMEMGGNASDLTMTSGWHLWTPIEFLVMFAMWVVMMAGMMTPSAAPMILLYARVGRQSELQGKPLAATGYFFAGYVFAWIGFALLATLAQWALENTLLLTPMMASASRFFSGILLIVIGLFQWTPLKDVCLRQCQAPLMFIQQHGGFRRDPFGSLSIGFRHGAYCVGCCWALMGLLFIGGVMNVLWIAAIAIYVLAEKIVPSGRWLSRLAGIGLGLTGLWVLGTAILS